MSYIFEPRPTTALKTVDGGAYPVSRVFCVGRNYAAHAVEMGKDPTRDPPFYFTKWAETVVNADPSDDRILPYPPGTANYHHEIELVVAIGAPGFRVSQEAARDIVFGYATGLDMTRRDRQLEAREKGRPWDVGKNVEESCPTGRLHPAAQVGHVETGAITLSVNGAPRQEADLTDLIWSTAEIIADLSTYYALRPGDLIYTGTPAGVGAVVEGDVLIGEIAGLSPVQARIGAGAG